MHASDVIGVLDLCCVVHGWMKLEKIACKVSAFFPAYPPFVLTNKFRTDCYRIFLQAVSNNQTGSKALKRCQIYRVLFIPPCFASGGALFAIGNQSALSARTQGRKKTKHFQQ